MQTTTYHIPALLQATIDGVVTSADGVYVDVTFGGGGHSRELLSRLSPKGRLFGLDQDLDAAANCPDDPRFQFVRSNFRYLQNFMRYYDVEHIDGLVADLGVSFHHFDEAQRGFSFRFNGPLDMRMNQRATRTAADIVNSYSEQQLAQLFKLYGELPQHKQLARRIVQQRAAQPIETIEQFCTIVAPLCGRDKEKKDYSRIFQALRIETNDEMAALREMLTAALQLLKTGGRMAVLTYHSLEDRIVKNFLRSGNFEGVIEKDFYGNPITPFRLINNKPIVPSEEEISVNPRSRSAKLRIAEKRE